MSTEYQPKATFTSKKVKGQRVFTAVNKRAKTVAKKAGKRKYLTVGELKAFVGKGSYVFYEYKDGNLKDPQLQKIRF